MEWNKTNGMRILGIGSAVPKHAVTNEKLSERVDTNDEWIQTRTGIAQRYYCEDGESCTTLAVKAAEDAIAKAAVATAASGAIAAAGGVSATAGDAFAIAKAVSARDEAVQEIKDRIRVIVVATSSADYGFPSTACLVQKALGLHTQVMSFDLGAACSGFLYGMQVCRGLLQGQQDALALLIGSEQLSRILDFEDRGSCILFGDGAGAALLQLDETQEKPFWGLSWSDGDFEISSEEDKVGAEVASEGDHTAAEKGSTSGMSPKALFMKGHGNGQQYLQMNGKDVFKFAVRVVPSGIQEILAEAGMTMDDIDHVVCHQANARIIDNVKRHFKGHEDKFYMNIASYGNTSAASIPLTLAEMEAKGILKEGQRALCVGFGAGFTWSAVIFTR